MAKLSKAEIKEILDPGPTDEELAFKKELENENWNLANKYRNRSKLSLDSILRLPLDQIAKVRPFESGLNIGVDPIEIHIIGAGGTGGYLIRDLCRFIYAMEKRLQIDMTKLELHIHDGDDVEEKNILRQNFMPNDISRNKAEVMAERHTRAFGTNIIAHTEMFNYSKFYRANDKVYVFVGCVDNNHARREIAMTFDQLVGGYDRLNQKSIWIDAGNEKKSGQVVLGSKTVKDVTDLYPELLLKKHDSIVQVSCADRMLEDEQNLFVNLTAANILLNYLRKILLNEPLVTNGCVFTIDNKFDNYFITGD